MGGVALVADGSRRPTRRAYSPSVSAVLWRWAKDEWEQRQLGHPCGHLLCLYHHCGPGTSVTATLPPPSPREAKAAPQGASSVVFVPWGAHCPWIWAGLGAGHTR